MVSGAQTKVCGLFVAPSGHRFVMQSGTDHFHTATTITLTVQMRRLVCAILTPEQARAAANTTSQIGAYLPYVSASHLAIGGLPTPYRVIVSRLRAPAGLKFSYSFVGW